MPVGIRSYDGTMSYEKGVPNPAKRDGLKKTLRQTVGTFRTLGNRFLNLIDYQDTQNLPLKQRKACDADGDFDEDAIRPVYRAEDHPRFPMHVHSTITEGEAIEVNSEDELQRAVATRKWSITPLEKKRRFTLTPEDQLVSMKGEIHAERARGLEMERRLEQVLENGPDGMESATLLQKQLESERAARISLEARMEQLMSQMTMLMESKTAPADVPASESVEADKANVRKRNAA